MIKIILLVGVLVASCSAEPVMDSTVPTGMEEVQVIEQIKEPVVEVIPEAPKREYINVELTAYCPCYECSEGYGTMTASGKRASKGTLAVPKSIPLGTKFIIDGVEHRAEDRGGAIKVKEDGTHIIDVYFSKHSDTVKFGRKKTKMYLEDGKYFINIK